MVQIFNATSELKIHAATPATKANQKLKHNHWHQKQKQENVQGNAKLYTSFYAFYSLNHYVLFLLKDNFLPHLFF